MYSLFKGFLLSLLKTPADPPDPPVGKLDSVRTFRASPKFLHYRLVVYALRQVPGALFSLVIGITMLSGLDGDPLEKVFLQATAIVIIAGATVGTLLRYWMIRIDYDLRYYILTDRSLRIRQGAWRINEATFTFANIQNLTIHQGPLERMLGISNVVIETAGGGGAVRQQGASQGAMMHSGVLQGIEDAEGMRDQIMQLLKQYRDAGLGDDKPEAPAPSQMTPGMGSGLPPQTIPLLRQVREEARMLAWAARDHR